MLMQASASAQEEDGSLLFQEAFLKTLAPVEIITAHLLSAQTYASDPTSGIVGRRSPASQPWAAP